MDPQRLVQRLVERSAMVAELPPQLLFLLGVGEGGRTVNAPLSRSGAAGAGRRGLGAVPSASCHHVAVPPPHKSPLLGLGGRHGEARPLVPPGRRGVVVRNLHHHLPGAAGGCRPLLRLHRRLRPRLRGCELPPRCHGHRLRPRLCNRGRQLALHGRRCRRRHCDRRRRLRLHRDRRPPLLNGRRLQRGGRNHRLRP
jgi:hypothetical protein